MTIRPSLAQDRPEWFRMRRALWPDCSPERHLLEIEQLIAGEGRNVVLVAVRNGGGLCGFAELSIRRDHVDGASAVPVAYLEGWYVDADVRRHGVGRRLLQAAEKWAADRGLKELASDAELNNQGSIEAHVSCGFAETCRAVHFIKPIGLHRDDAAMA
jgi:aminoglycoside 6'-N-acetyltransferase I